MHNNNSILVITSYQGVKVLNSTQSNVNSIILNSVGACPD